MTAFRLLVVDGNTRETDERHVALGGAPTGERYVRVLKAIAGDIECLMVHPAWQADPGLPADVSLNDFDGVVWTGSALHIYDDSPAVRAQLELSRAVFAAGVPQFGSCWGLQVATVAAGGKVRANPKGREVGIARGITPIDTGLEHPMFEGKRKSFDAVAVHMDEVAVLPVDSVRLAENPMSAVQAAEIRSNGGIFWGVQYHPEYDLNEIATIMLRYGEQLVRDLVFPDMDALNRFVADMHLLHTDPTRLDVAAVYGIDEDVLNPSRRRLEIKRWFDQLVVPYAASRARR
jgi:GMP synthase (glutamine-hydrolysing)